MNMKLIGAPTIADVVPSMVDTTALNGGHAPDTMFDANCESLFLSCGVS
jgi:L-lactate dehydrogenase (cytochrome)